MKLRCPHCHNPIEVVADDPLTNLECPSCGSEFHLISADDTQSYSPGTRKIAHFELLQPVGTGKFGTVWKAKDTQLDRFVAIKVPRTSQLTEQEMEQFLREARAASQIDHPGVVGVHEVGRDGDTVFIVSEYVDGANLADWLKVRRPSLRESATLCVAIAESLQAAHDAGVVHRDLKPGNVIMDRDDQPHLTDFGLAKRDAGEITVTLDGKILGTPAYMSPEQAKGKAHEANTRSDVYSLGVILYELMTGELPFRGERQMLIVQILCDEPDPPKKLNSRIPRELQTICLKCLEKNPKKRYDSARALADDLRLFLGGEQISARPRGAYRWVWTILAAIVLFIGLWVLQDYSYALFHTFAEFFSAIIAVTTFLMFLQSGGRTQNSFFVVLGSGYFYVAILLIMHASSMGPIRAFPGYGTNLGIQFWIAARFLQASTVVAALILIHRQVWRSLTFAVFSVLFFLVLVCIFAWDVFPTCFVSGAGLTSFKILSEFAIIGLFLLGLLLLGFRRNDVGWDVAKLLAISIVSAMCADAGETLYRDVTGLANFLAHYLYIVSFYFTYRAMSVAFQNAMGLRNIVG